jgi:hypothetical protein
MFYLFKTEEGYSHIAEEDEKNNAFIIEANDMNNNNFDIKIGDTLSTDQFHEIIATDKHVSQAELVSSFQNSQVSVQIYKTSSDLYQVVSNGIIRHPNIDADGAIRAISIYSNS